MSLRVDSTASLAARCRAARGFTLLELILVLLIVGLMIAVAAPALNRLGARARLDAEARRLVAMAAEARGRAAAEATPYRLRIDPVAHECWIEAMTPTGFARPAMSYAEVVPLDARITCEIDAEEVDGSADRYAIRFEPDGRIGEGRVLLTDTRGRRRLIYRPSLSEPFRAVDPDDPALDLDPHLTAELAIVE